MFVTLGLLVFDDDHVKETLQVLAFAGMVQLVGLAEILPNAADTLIFALQLSSDPPFDPSHDQLHGPDPDMPEKFPWLQYPDEGVDEYVPPSEGPHTPLTAPAARFALQKSFDPPFDPLHDQLHGPEPDMPE